MPVPARPVQRQGPPAQALDQDGQARLGVATEAGADRTSASSSWSGRYWRLDQLQDRAIDRDPFGRLSEWLTLSDWPGSPLSGLRARR